MSNENQSVFVVPVWPAIVCLAGGTLLSSVIFGPLPILCVAAGCLVTAGLLSRVRRMIAKNA
jgi:hypothetical protein